MLLRNKNKHADSIVTEVFNATTLMRKTKTSAVPHLVDSQYLEHGARDPIRGYSIRMAMPPNCEVKTLK